MWLPAKTVGAGGLRDRAGRDRVPNGGLQRFRDVLEGAVDLSSTRRRYTAWSCTTRRFAASDVYHSTLAYSLGGSDKAGVSLVVIAGACWLTNRLFTSMLKIPANSESFLITALILAVIMPPVNGARCRGNRQPDS